MTYTVEYIEAVVKQHIPSLPKTVKVLIKKAIEERLATDPVAFGKPLRYSFKGPRRLRVGDYRIVYRIDPHCNNVTIVAILHRKDVYES